MPTRVQTGYRFGAFELLPVAHTLKRDGSVIDLPPKEFGTLLLLVERAGQVVDKETFVKEVWDGTFVGDGSLARTISVLRKNVGADAIETVPRLGYRFVWTVTSLEPARDANTPFTQNETPAASVPANGLAVPQQIDSRKPSRARSAIVIGMLALLGCAGWLLVRHWKQVRTETNASYPVRIAVLPFRNLSNHPDSDVMARALTEELISAFSQVDQSRIRVLDGRSTSLYQNSGLPPDSIAKKLGVRYLVDGTLNDAGKTAEINIQLVDGSDQSVLWSAPYRRNLDDLPQLEVDLAEAASRKILLKILPAEVASLHPGESADPVAQNDYLEGRLALERKNVPAFWQALGHFREAVQADPQYARAYAGISETYINLANNIPAKPAYAQAKLASQTALKLDDHVAEAHRDLAWILFTDEANVRGAEQEYRRALELNPKDARTHHWYAQLLMAERRPEEALKEARTGLALDPLSLSSHYNYGTILILAGKPQEAIELLNDLLVREPDNEVANGYLGLAYEEAGDYGKAAQCLRKAMQLSALKYQYEAAMAYAMAKNRDRNAAARIATELDRKIQHGVWVPAYNMAVLYAGLGNADESFHWIDKCVADRSCSLLEVNTDPLYRELHQDPRLALVANRLGLRN